jgi:hypothetical protein
VVSVEGAVVVVVVVVVVLDVLESEPLSLLPQATVRVPAANAAAIPAATRKRTELRSAVMCVLDSVVGFSAKGTWKRVTHPHLMSIPSV